ncbi:MAG: YqaA family protein [Alphaproteobacteria bacterium]|jgi:membrane protein YqaA with SNARE-associated domain|nr:YqaA family protein [Alphaproteobacteria bacterium]
MLRRLYDWTLDLAAHRHAIWWLALIAFVESSIFPIPPDAMLIPMILAARERWLAIAVVCTVASVVGGLAGYGIGHFLFESVGSGIVEFYGYGDKFAQFQTAYDEWGAWLVAGAGLTPFPYKVITIASGVFALDPVVFVVASVLSRGARFFAVALLLWWLGPPIRDFIEARLGLVATLFFILLISGFLVLRWIG